MSDILNSTKSWQDRGYGSPYDRGSADAYYGRNYNPHFYIDGMYRVPSSDMTMAQIEDYRLGYTEETDQKDWG